MNPKKLIAGVILTLISSLTITAEETIPLTPIKTPPEDDYSKPRKPFHCIVKCVIKEDYITLESEDSCYGFLEIFDEFGTAIIQSDVSLDPVASIAISGFECGFYTIYITINGTTFEGQFIL